ncbi:FG-GAP-like repeat-containing protein [Glycomyces sp. TRM65418]|uniref:LamG-like jellyroll fold domain-containing protein n=1 Tax=Glycomyces sp. TRM65418 TaxID=2867006 RepID=UPI001CE620D7|nr:LamG-like jellyroll fold domain-containing protein [Glycomyces sp. TRM65418]MCC3765531.1 FG-GAP-like repeat-containing protein [Glycomyces sp. TRM65418]QZD55138.1 FG-GAP-like repeat-containing protein [Glycomyces sp. TRM65418]
MRSKPPRPIALRLTVLAAGAAALAVFITPPPVFAQETDPPSEGVPAGSDSSPSETDTEIADAVSEAAETGVNVEIDSLASDSSEVFAAPDGTFVEEIALEPFQAQTDDGTWADIDNTLVADGDGRLVPANSDLQLALSAGGTTEIATITDVHGRTVSYTWHEALPTPTVSGDTAVYAEILPGVDLKVRPTNTGFAKVFEVKTAEAAASGEVASIELGLVLDGFTAAVGETGALEISDYEGNVVYGGPTPLMWDSAAADEGVGDAATGEWSPATFSMSATVGTAFADGVLTLTPDAAMLSDPAAVFPIRIDPDVVKVDSSAWAMISDYSSYRNNSYYNGGSFEKDPNGTARLGRAHRADGSMEQTWRLAFEFNTSKFRGKDIIDANLRMTMTYSWMRSCDGISATADLYELDAGNLRNWTWNNQSGDWGTKIASRDEGIASGCGAPRQLWTDVTGYVKDVARTSDKKIQFGLRASSESCGTHCPGFRRFGPEKVGDGRTGFYLSVKYNTAPNKPGSFTIDDQSCAAGKTVKLGAGTSWTVTAKLTDDEGDNMDGVLTWKDQVAGTTKTWNSSGADRAKATWTVKASDLTGQKYTATVAAKDGRATGASAGGCTVLIDTTPPVAPSVVSTDYPADGKVHGAVGMTGRFTIDSTSTDTAGYSWSLQDAYGDNTVPVSTLGAAATIALDPTSSGPQALSVWAFDQHGNVSAKTTYQFSVNPNGSPVAHWKLDETTGTRAADTNYPGYPSDVTRPLTLTGGAWTGGTAADAAADHLQYLTLDGDDQAVTAEPVIATNSSYTVSAWVRIHQTDVDYTIASQDGLVNSAFMLKYDGESHTFLMVASNQDSTASGLRAVSAGSNVTAEAGIWYHVTGVFSFGSQQLQLYVDGQLQNTAAFTDEWRSTGVFAVGRDLWGGKKSTYYAGDVDDVKVWNRAVPAGEIQRLGQHAEGVWDFETVNTDVFPDLSGDGNELSGTAVELVEGFEGMAAGLNGSSSTATTWSPVLDTAGDFTVGAWVRLDRDGDTATAIGQDGVNGSAFYLGYVATYDKWAFRAIGADADSSYTWKELYADTPVQVGQWTHLAATYEASTGTATLYINGLPAGKSEGFKLWSSTGSFRVGSVLHRSAVTDYWPGAIDNVNANSGVFDDQQVKALADGTVRETYSELVTGDFNGDEFADALAVVEADGLYSDIYLLRNDGSGNLVRSTEPVFESDTLNLDAKRDWRLSDAVWRAGDVNGDGRDDLVVAVPGDDHFEVWAMPACGPRDRVCTKDGSTFKYSEIERLDLSAANGWELSETQIQIEDLSGDQADDLVLLRGDGSDAYSIWQSKFVRNGEGKRAFSAPTQVASGSGDSRLIELAVGDFDADWWGDVVEIRTGADGSADMYVRYGSASGLGAPVYALDTPNNWDTERDRVTVADVTGDGLPDLVATYRFTNRVRVNVAAALPDRRFATTAAWDYSDRCTGCPSDLTPWAHTDLAGGDVNGDGKGDLLTLRAGTGGGIGALWTRMSTGNGFAVADPTWADPETCFGVEGDVNGDGYPDAVLSYGSYAAQGLANAGAVWFIDGASGEGSLIDENTHGGAGTVEAGDQFGYAVDTYDRDGDGCADIVAGVPGENDSTGSAIVLPGSRGGIDESGVFWFNQISAGMPGKNEADDRFGWSVAASNRRDGTPVLIIGLPGEDVQTDTSGAYRDGDTEIPEVVDGGAVIYLQGDSKAWVDQNTDGVTGGVEEGDQFGWSIAATRTRFIVGVPFEDGGPDQLTDAGGALVFTHEISAEGWPVFTTWLDQQDAALAAGFEAGDRLGYTVAAVDYWPASSGMDSVQTRFAIAVPWEDLVDNTVANAGLVHLVNMDGSGGFTGVANYDQGVHLGDSPEEFDHLGLSLGLFDLDPSLQANNDRLKLVIGVPDENFATGDDDGLVHVTGAAVATADVDTMISDPSANSNGKFGTDVDATDSGLYITAPGTGPMNCLVWSGIPATSQQTVTATAI